MISPLPFMSASAGEYSTVGSASGGGPGFVQTGMPTQSMPGSLLWFWAAGKGADMFRDRYANNVAKYAAKGPIQRAVMNRIMGSRFVASTQQQVITGALEEAATSASPTAQKLFRRALYGTSTPDLAGVTAGQVGRNVTRAVRGSAFGIGPRSAAGKQLLSRGLRRVGDMSVGGLGVRGTLGMGLHIYNRAMMAQFYNALPVMGAGAINMAAQYGVSEERKRRQMTGLEMYGRGFTDSQAAATMRQTAISHIQGAQMGLQRALSREAAFMHR